MTQTVKKYTRKSTLGSALSASPLALTALPAAKCLYVHSAVQSTVTTNSLTFMKLLKLNDWQTNEVFYLNPTHIVSIEKDISDDEGAVKISVVCREVFTVKGPIEDILAVIV